MEKARRRHVPVFGKWNYFSPSPSPSASPDDEPPPQNYGATVAESWWWHAPEPEACSNAWFRYSPPPRRRLPAPKKQAWRPEAATRSGLDAVAAEHKRPVPVAAARALAEAAALRVVVVRPVDEDLYRVPPPDDRKKRAARRSLWMGCLGINCVA